MRVMDNRPFKILIVEDDEAHAELIIENLRDHKVITDIFLAKDGAVALDYLLQRNQYKSELPPNLILLDLRLPKVSGHEVLEVIKNNESLCTIPVVILTTSEDDKDIQRAYESHANSYLVKPVDFQDFISLINKLGFYWIEDNKQLTISAWPINAA